MKTDIRLKEIFSDVFKLHIDEITSEISPNNCSAWDSLNMLKLIIDIEKGFNISISIEEVVVFNNYSDVLGLIEQKIEE